jgi:hypothetical protein
LSKANTFPELYRGGCVTTLGLHLATKVFAQRDTDSPVLKSA